MMLAQLSAAAMQFGRTFALIHITLQQRILLSQRCHGVDVLGAHLRRDIGLHSIHAK
jgi:hypothetical protein